MEKMKIKERVNWPVTILLLLGLITVAFPLYMTIVIALKKPSEMTNSISGILSLPSHLSLDNFAEAMRVTDFWHSLGNSVFITLVTVVLSILIHSLLGYAIGRNKKSKFYKFIYFYVVSGMFVPFAILMMPVVKQTAQMGLANRAGVIILYVVFYMPMNVLLYSGYLTNIPLALEEAACVDGASTWKTYWKIVFPDHETNACDSCSSDSTWYMERCNDTTRHHVRFRKRKYTSAGTAELPDTVWNKL